MNAQPSWQILECCLKKMMLVITASASPVFWCSAPPADLRVSWLLLASSHPFAVLCSDLVREIAAYSPSLPPLPALHMSFKFYYCNKSALCWLFSALCDGGYFQAPSPALLWREFRLGVWRWGCSVGGCVLAELQQEHPAPVVFGGGGREWAVDLHLHHGVNYVEVRLRWSGSLPLAHHQKLIKSEVWVELCAGFPGVPGSRGCANRWTKPQPFWRCAASKWMKCYKGEIWVLSRCSLVKPGMEFFVKWTVWVLAVASLALPCIC